MNTLNESFQLAERQRSPGSAMHRSLIGQIDFWLGSMVEFAAAALVVVEVALLFAGIVARYLLHAPLT